MYGYFAMADTRSKAAIRQANYRARKAAQSVTRNGFSQLTKTIERGLCAPPILKENGRSPEIGTTIATRKLPARVSMSITASPLQHSHSGAGRRATVTSHALTLHQCQQLLWASSHATLAGCPFNRHTTLHHEAIGIPNSAGHDAVATLIKLASDYLAVNGYRLHWIYTRENGLDKGAHAHILWHIPPAQSKGFFKRWPKWRAKLIQRYSRLGTGRGGRAIMTRPIGGSQKAYGSNYQAFSFHLDQTLGYVLKGASHEVIKRLSLSKPHQAGGAIIGRRAGWWQKHGPKRKSAMTERNRTQKNAQIPNEETQKSAALRAMGAVFNKLAETTGDPIERAYCKDLSRRLDKM